MPFEAEITKEQFDKLPDIFKENYKSDNEGESFKIQVNGQEDITALKNAKKRESDDNVSLRIERQSLLDKNADLEKQLKEAQKKKPGEGVDAEAIKAELSEEYKEQIASITSEKDKFQQFAKEQLEGSVAKEIAAKLIPDAPEVMIPHVQKFIGSDLENMSTLILDENGNPTTRNKEDLTNFFLENDSFKTIIPAGDARGSGAVPGTQHEGGAHKSLKEMNGIERVDFAKKHPEKYAQMLKNANMPMQ